MRRSNQSSAWDYADELESIIDSLREELAELRKDFERLHEAKASVCEECGKELWKIREVRDADKT